MNICPTISVLSREQKEQVHVYAKELLATVGMRMDCPRAHELMVKNGSRDLGQSRITIPGELIEWALAAAPAEIEIFQRTGQPAFKLGGAENSTRFGVGVTNLYYQDPVTDGITPFSHTDLGAAVRLGHALDGFDLVATPGIARDAEPGAADLRATLAMTANTTKPLVLLISEEKLFIPALALLESLHGDLSAHPAVIPYFNPITPLVLNGETSRKIAVTVERGLPFIYNNYGMSGATVPITPGGTLVVLTAELLGGLVYSQLLKAGAPVILGSLPAGFDMKTMASQYTPHTMLLNLACAEMMAHYRLPHSGTSGSCSGWGPDLMAAGTLWLNHLTSCIGKVGLAPFVGGNFDSLAFSPAMVVLASEIIRLSRQFADGFVLDRSSVDLDDVAAMGPGGNFLMSDMTCELFRHMGYESPVWPSLTLETWQARNCPKAATLLREFTAELLAGLAAPEDCAEIMGRGEDFIRAHTSGRG